MVCLQFDTNHLPLTNALKPDACFQCKGGDFIIKQGVKLNLDNLFDALKEKDEKYRKKNHQQQRQQKLSNTVLSSSTPITDADNSNNSTTQTFETETTTTSSSTSSFGDANTTNSSSFVSKFSSINDHIKFINDLIEKFSRKTFTSMVLKENEHYQLTVTEDDQTIKAVIKCQCGSKLMLPIRSDPYRFILSNFYAHLTTSTCPMTHRILKEEKKSRNKELEGQSIVKPVAQPWTIVSNDNNSDLAKQAKRKHDHNNSLTTKSSTKTTKKQKKQFK
ncbi:unnamed protein product [Rotaria sp. Silwood2]|nr:unnamed protein product [Rotaria sp. Silwood2]CAF3000475.1 unnamed protein product [Rotaria sp. Silwood2]CAF3367791.1 unnamed protein product [Rotaria sp. Silwood2]CAF4092109.1 unnamed protein product [Rotaria sp. Silwood2]CAF4269309.1 unnamed protein product [Rotaria sp. Silwood2]